MVQVQKNHSGIVTSITLRRPSDFHCHFRDGELQNAVAKYTMRWAHYGLAMPNNGPVTTTEEAAAYRDKLTRIAEERGYHYFHPLMTLYYTNLLTPKIIEDVAQSGFVLAIKWYPPHPGATTGSGHGVPLRDSVETLKAMERNRVPLCGHFESVYDLRGHELEHQLRETYFLNNELPWLLDTFPDLRIVLEHASTAEAARLLFEDQSDRLAATLTPQHLLFTADDLKNQSWGRHLKCMPIVKTKHDRAALRALLIHRRVFAGTDSAPHLSKAKSLPFEQCANGCFTSTHALALYAQMFEEMGMLDWRFENFMSLNGPSWYGLPLPTDTVTLTREEGFAPSPVPVPGTDDVVVPLGWSEEDDCLKTHWKLV